MGKRWNRRKLLAFLAGLGLGGAALFVHSPRFGALPDSEEKARFAQSLHFRHGRFCNTLATSVLAKGESSVKIWLDFLFGPKRERLVPKEPLPVVKSDFWRLAQGADCLVWLGHSSFFLHFAGLNILIDPVLSSYAAPLPLAVRAFPGTSVFHASDFPPLDLLLISHDHWDHLDYATLQALLPKTAQVVTGLGVGAHLRRFGCPEEKIHEADWGDSLRFGELSVHVTCARHFSGRFLTRDASLWVGFALQGPQHKLFFSGDSGYGPHFAEIGQQFGGFDLVLLDMGQYNSRWPDIHMCPEQTAQAADDLQARALVPTHVGRFCISTHPWDEPFLRMAKAAQNHNFAMLSPRIGESLFFDRTMPFPAWWQGRA